MLERPEPAVSELTGGRSKAKNTWKIFTFTHTRSVHGFILFPHSYPVCYLVTL